MAVDLSIPSPTPRVSLHEAPVSWSAILVGAVVALATSMLLTLLAAGFDLALVPAGLATRSALEGFSPMAGALAVAVQVISAGFGGFVAGRLRHLWLSAHADESHFRDTAHGLAVWAVATIFGLVLAALVLVPYAEQLAAESAAAVATPPPTPADLDRARHIAAQAAFFSGIGMLLAAFTAAVAARLGGQQVEHMHTRHLSTRTN